MSPQPRGVRGPHPRPAHAGDGAPGGREVRRPAGLLRPVRRARGRDVVDDQLGADLGADPAGRGCADRPRRGEGRPGGDHGRQPDRPHAGRLRRDGGGRDPDVDLQHPRPGPGRLHRGRVPAGRRDPRGPRPLPALGEGPRRRRLGPPRRDARRRRPRRRPARDDVGRLPRPRRRHQRRRGADGPDHPRPAGHLPLHLGHDGQPQGRRPDPPQRHVRGRLHARQRRPAGPAADHLLPAARPHRRAGAGDVRPALPRQPRARDPRPRRPPRCAGRGAPDGVLRRAARLGEDQDRHLGQARRGPRPGQPGAREERDGGGPRVDAGPRVRQRDDAGGRGGLRQGGRRDPRRSSACCSGSTRSSGRPARPRRCRWRSPSSWAASACRCTTSTA